MLGSIGKTCDECKLVFKGTGSSCQSCRKNVVLTRKCDGCNNFWRGTERCDCGWRRPFNDITNASEGAAPCYDCKNPLMGPLVECANRMYHEGCLKCTTCRNRLNNPVYVADDKLYCKGCVPKDQPNWEQGVSSRAPPPAKKGEVPCYDCFNPLSGNMVECEGRIYHEGCLKCTRCRDELKDTVYEHEDDYYCRPCVENKKYEERGISQLPPDYSFVANSGECASCLKSIEDQYYVRLPNKDKLHRECFKCEQCRDILDPRNHSLLDNGQRVCYKCDPDRNCKKCRKVIYGSTTVYNGKSFHPDCFTCKDCRQPLSGTVLVTGDDIVCGPCYEQRQDGDMEYKKREMENAPPPLEGEHSNAPAYTYGDMQFKAPPPGDFVSPGDCKTCAKPIDDQYYVRVEDDIMHSECFQCTKCKSVLDPKNHSILAGTNDRVCYSCDPMRECEKCRQTIFEEATEFRSKRYHPGCFTCDVCSEHLTGRVVVKGDRKMCEDCKAKEKRDRSDRHAASPTSSTRVPVTTREADLGATEFGAAPPAAEGCSKCEKPLEGTVLAWEGRKFHDECFTCTACTAPMREFYSVGDDKFCQYCLEPAQRARELALLRDSSIRELELSRPTRTFRASTVQNLNNSRLNCISCTRSIEDQSYVKVEQGEMHLKCFSCNKCGDMLNPAHHTVLPDGRTRICFKCDPSKECGKCKGTIYEDATEFKGTHYHPACFTCDLCSKHLSGRVFMKEGIKSCEECRELSKSQRNREGGEERKLRSKMSVVQSPRPGYGPCAECGDELSGSVVAFEGKNFHQDCFKCHKCQDKLSGRIYPHGGKNYCLPCRESERERERAERSMNLSSPRGGTDTQMKSPRSAGYGPCAECNQELSGSVVAFEGKNFHQDCFRCHKCRDPLSGRIYPYEGHNYCLPCRESERKNMSSPRGGASHGPCSGCGNPLSGSVMTFEGKNFHDECFLCGKCGDKLSTRIYPHEGVNYCSKCRYRPEAIRCSDCSTTITGEYSKLSDGRTLCMNCKPLGSKAGPDTCSGCSEALTGSYKVLGDKKFHPACFQCSECHNVIEGKFGMRGMNVQCLDCLRK